MKSEEKRSHFASLVAAKKEKHARSQGAGGSFESSLLPVLTHSAEKGPRSWYPCVEKRERGRGIRRARGILDRRASSSVFSFFFDLLLSSSSPTFFSNLPLRPRPPRHLALLLLLLTSRHQPSLS